MTRKPKPAPPWTQGSTVRLTRVTEHDGRYVGDGNFTLEWIAEDGSTATDDVHAIRSRASDEVNWMRVGSPSPTQPASAASTTDRPAPSRGRTRRPSRMVKP